MLEILLLLLAPTQAQNQPSTPSNNQWQEMGVVSPHRRKITKLLELFKLLGKTVEERDG